jgi:hypothetical protein
MVLYQMCVFGADLKSNMAARVHNVFSLAALTHDKSSHGLWPGELKIKNTQCHQLSTTKDALQKHKEKFFRQQVGNAPVSRYSVYNKQKNMDG